MKKILSLSLVSALVFISSCRKETTSAPTGLTYKAPNKIVAIAGSTGTSDAPTVNWNGGVGKFVIASVGSTTLLDGGTPGLTIDQSTGVISWANTTPAGTYIVKVNAVNDGGSVTTLADTIQLKGVAYNTTFDFGNATATLVYNANNGASITPIATATAGTYAVVGTLPTNVTLASTTGQLTWTNKVPLSSTGTDTTYTIQTQFTPTVAGTAQSTPLILKLTVKAAQTRIAYSPSTLSYNIGRSVDTFSAKPSTIDSNASTSPYAISAIVSKLVTYPVDVASPTVNGISIDPTTGRLSFSKSLSSGIYTITVNRGTPVINYTLTIKDYFSYTKPNDTFVTNTTQKSSVAPVFVGTTGVYLINGIKFLASTTTTAVSLKAVPGIELNPTTGVLSYSGALAKGVYTITVENSNVTTNKTTNPSASTVDFKLTVQ